MKAIKSWFSTFFHAWWHRYRMVFGDIGVMLFFFGLPLAYPLVYTAIYNPEVVRDVPVIVVDNSRTADSRQLTRMFDASQYTEVAGYATDLDEARTMLKERKAYAILEIPRDYAKRIGRGEQAVFPVYSDMSLLLRYRSVLFGVTEIQLQLGEELRERLIADTPLVAGESLLAAGGVEIEPYFLGDESQGFASFIMIGVLVVILQQSLMLGIFMLAGGSNERRRANGGRDPQATPGPASADVLGRTFCYVTIYLPLLLYVLHYVPVMFDLPHIGSIWQSVVYFVPFLFGAAFLAQALRGLIYERESSMLVWVFTSVVMLFISGLTWPTSAMTPFWHVVNMLLPVSWGVEGFVGINSNGSDVNLMSTPYLAMWLITLFYFGMAWLVEKRVRLRSTLPAKPRTIPIE